VLQQTIRWEIKTMTTDEPLDIEDEPIPHMVQPWLTRFGILTLLFGNLFAIIGIILYWIAGGRNLESVVSLVVCALFVTGILSTRKHLRS
jgi:hypothetical protein